MRNRSLATDHDAAVARRLELLTSELASVRDADSWAPHAHTRIRAVPDPDPDPWATPPSGADGEPAGPLPHLPGLPGRHASRRGGSVSDALTRSVPETLRGRIPLSAGHVAVVAVVAVVGLVVTCWWLVRSGGHEVAAPFAVSTPRAALATPDGATSGAAPVSGSPAPAAKVVVDVVGRVRRPGIAVLRSGDRVVDAIRAAGGVRPGVGLGSLNLAQPLTDGEQIVVGAPVGAAPPASAPVSGAPVTGLVDLNTADETALESLPEVGPVTAQAILTWRSQHGGFSSVDQLLDVDGIGDATLAKLTPYVTI
jgi:competence protein ComEA